MEKHEAILAELEKLREGAASRIRARLEAVQEQIREFSSRAAREVSAVIPPDLETLFPVAALSERLQELAKPAAPAGVSLEVMRRLDAGHAQSEVLQELLKQLGAWCGPRVIVVLREGNAVQGWAGEGLTGGPPVKSWQGALANSLALRRAAEGVPVVVDLAAEEMLARWFDAAQGRLLLVPMSLRGKVVGMLLALEGESGLDTAIVQQLTYTVGLMLETMSGRTVVTTAALIEPEVLVGKGEGASAPERVPTSELFELEEGVPTPAMVRPVSPQVTPPLADASATVHLKVPVAPKAAPAPPPTGARPAVAPPPVAPPPPAPPPPRAAVAPPPAAPGRAPDDERKHEEARRFARLLVSEIRLYNEQAVQAGKISRDIYQRLKEDIDRSREMYDQRVSADVRSSTNYFHDELVRILADGEPDALGM
jgi:hypothetical protein